MVARDRADFEGGGKGGGRFGWWESRAGTAGSTASNVQVQSGCVFG